MSEQHVTATQMFWHPKLIRLSASAPNINEGAPYAVFVNPDNIIAIELMKLRINEGDPEATELRTVIKCMYSINLVVTDPPEVVASKREAAYGHESALKSV